MLSEHRRRRTCSLRWLRMMKKRIRNAVIGIPVFLVVFLVASSPLLYFGYIAYRFVAAHSVETDPAQYDLIISKRMDAGYGPRFFPIRIPSNVEIVGFYYVPGAMQGGTTIALRLKFSEWPAKFELEDFDRQRNLTVSELREAGFTNFIRTLPPFEERWTVSWQNMSELNENYELFLQDADLDDLNDHRKNNVFSYVAISEINREIFYYFTQL